MTTSVLFVVYTLTVLVADLAQRRRTEVARRALRRAEVHLSRQARLVADALRDQASRS